jgi:hypothetical protein
VKTAAAAKGIKAGREQKGTKAMKILVAQNFEPPALDLHFGEAEREIQRTKSRQKRSARTRFSAGRFGTGNISSFRESRNPLKPTRELRTQFCVLLKKVESTRLRASMFLQ